MPTELEELVEFLHSSQPAVVSIALDNLVGFSKGPEQHIFNRNNYEPIKDLKKLVHDEGKTTVSQSLTILINLSDSLLIRNILVEDDEFLKFLVTRILNVNNSNAELMTILLANLAKNDSIIKVLTMKITHDEASSKVFKSSSAIDCLMDCFVKGFDRSLNKYASFDYLAYFFADLSRFLEGRNYFITVQDYDGVVPVSKLLVFTEKYDNKIRREGVCSTIKNSLFDTASHMKLLKDDKINLLPYILLPLAGPEEIDEDDMFNLPEELQLLPSDKQRDPVDSIICIHLESILLLCTTREGREYLREKSVYAIIKELHKVSQNEDVLDLCDRVVQMLMRDEAKEGEDEEEEDDDDDDDKVVEVV